MIRTAIASLFILCYPVGGMACTYGYCWGGVGYGPDGVTGYAVNKSNAADAERATRAACGDKCTKVEVFNDSCASLAMGGDTLSFLALAPSIEKASEQALASCSASFEHCIVRVTACSMK